MSETKVLTRYYTITDWEKEQEFLRQQHMEGWKLEKVSGLCRYHFVRCDPEDVVYQLDYNQEGAAHREEYLQMFRDCGWEHIQDYVGYSYFRKPAARMQGKEEIFCDDSSRLDMLTRVFRGRMVPLLLLFFLALVPLTVLSFLDGMTVFGWLYVAILGLYLWLFTVFGIRYGKFRKKLGL